MSDASLIACERSLRTTRPERAGPLAPRPAGQAPRPPASGLPAILGVRAHRRRVRRELRRLAEECPDYLLRDIDLRREDVMREAMKPFWRA